MRPEAIASHKTSVAPVFKRTLMFCRNREPANGIVCSGNHSRIPSDGDVLHRLLGQRSIDAVRRGRGNQHVGPWSDREIDREMVAPDQAAGGIHQQRVRTAGIIEINRREKMPGRLALCAVKDGAVALTHIFQHKPPNASDRRRSNSASSRRGRRARHERAATGVAHVDGCGVQSIAPRGPTLRPT